MTHLPVGDEKKISKVYYLRDGDIIEELQVPYDLATVAEKVRWAAYQQTHVKRTRVLTKDEIVKLLNINP